MPAKLFQKVSQAPTHPRPTPTPRRFDVAELYEGPASLAEAPDPRALPLDEKCAAPTSGSSTARS